MTQALIFLHVACGALVLLVGLILMFRPKGTRLHRRLGWMYVLAMWTICLSAFLLIAFHRFSFFLMVVGVLTFYFTFVGVRVVRRPKQGKEQWYDWVVSIVTFAFGLGLIGYGIYVAFLVGGFHVVALLGLIFGFGTAQTAWKDIRFFVSKGEPERKWWLYQHINAMGGSYIAAVTALAVQNGNAFLPGASYGWLLWILPGIVGSFVVGGAIRRIRGTEISR